jgi:hypothetical protein
MVSTFNQPEGWVIRADDSTASRKQLKSEIRSQNEKIMILHYALRLAAQGFVQDDSFA